MPRIMVQDRRCAICGDLLEDFEKEDICWDCQNLMISNR